MVIRIVILFLTKICKTELDFNLPVQTYGDWMIIKQLGFKLANRNAAEMTAY